MPEPLGLLRFIPSSVLCTLLLVGTILCASAAHASDSNFSILDDSQLLDSWRRRFGLAGDRFDVVDRVPLGANKPVEVIFAVPVPNYPKNLDLNRLSSRAPGTVHYIELRGVLPSQLKHVSADSISGVTHLRVQTHAGTDMSGPGWKMPVQEMRSIRALFPNLEGLLLDGLALNADCLAELAKCESLVEFGLSGKVDGGAAALFGTFAGMPQLRRLELSSIELPFWTAELWPGCERLTWLNIGLAAVLDHDEFWKSLTRLKGLEYLGLGTTSTTGWNASRIGTLRALKELAALALYGRTIEGPEICTALGALPKLRHLCLPDYGSLIEGETEMPQGLTQLITLYLPRFDTDFARWVSNLSALQEFSFRLYGYNHCWEKGHFRTLEKFSKLTRLDMEINGVSEAAYAGMDALSVKDLRVRGLHDPDALAALIAACPNAEVILCNHRVVRTPETTPAVAAPAAGTPEVWSAIRKCSRLRVLSIGYGDAKELGAAFEVLPKLEVYCDPAAKDWTRAVVEAVLKARNIQVVVRLGLGVELMKQITDARPTVRIHRGQAPT